MSEMRLSSTPTVRETTPVSTPAVSNRPVVTPQTPEAQTNANQPVKDNVSFQEHESSQNEPVDPRVNFKTNQKDESASTTQEPELRSNPIGALAGAFLMLAGALGGVSVNDETAQAVQQGLTKAADDLNKKGLPSKNIQDEQEQERFKRLSENPKK